MRISARATRDIRIAGWATKPRQQSCELLVGPPSLVGNLENCWLGLPARSAVVCIAGWAKQPSHQYVFLVGPTSPVINAYFWLGLPAQSSMGISARAIRDIRIAGWATQAIRQSCGLLECSENLIIAYKKSTSLSPLLLNSYNPQPPPQFTSYTSH